MRADYELLFESMKRSVSYRPANLPAALRSLSPVDELPPTSSIWLFIGLARHRRRQEAIWEMVKERLPDAIPPSEELLARFHEVGRPFTIDLPGCAPWVIDLECDYMDGFVRNMWTREALWISLGDDEYQDHKIDLDVVLTDMPAISMWDPEARIIDFCMYLNDDLVAAQVLKTVDDNGQPATDIERPWYVFTHEAILQLSVIDEFLMRWREHENRLWLSALVNDWGLAHELALIREDLELTKITGARTVECQKRLGCYAERWDPPSQTNDRANSQHKTPANEY